MKGHAHRDNFCSQRRTHLPLGWLPRSHGAHRLDSVSQGMGGESHTTSRPKKSNGKVPQIPCISPEHLRARPLASQRAPHWQEPQTRRFSAQISPSSRSKTTRSPSGGPSPPSITRPPEPGATGQGRPPKIYNIRYVHQFKNQLLLNSELSCSWSSPKQHKGEGGCCLHK